MPVVRYRWLRLVAETVGIVTAGVVAGLALNMHGAAVAGDLVARRSGPPDSAWLNIRSEGSTIGPAGAPVAIVEFSDFECSFCAIAAPDIEAVLDKFDGKVRLRFFHYPLPFHANAWSAAIAVECAARQGRFREYSRLLFTERTVIKNREWEAAARRAGVADSAAFRACILTEEPAARIKEDLKVAEGLGVHSTPTIRINGRIYRGEGRDEIAALIRQELDIRWWEIWK
jgi:protein-disulfide isomerase